MSWASPSSFAARAHVAESTRPTLPFPANLLLACANRSRRPHEKPAQCDAWHRKLLKAVAKTAHASSRRRSRPQSWRDDVNGQLADLTERMTAAEPKAYSEVVSLLVRRKPVKFLELLRISQRDWFLQLVEAVREDDEWNGESEDE
jgi:hypothetical protein